MKSLKLFVLSFIMCFSPFCFAQDSTSEQGEIQQFVFSIDDAAEVVEQPQEEKQEKEFLEGYIEVKDEQEIKLEEPEDILLETDFSPTYRVNEIKKVSTYSKSLELPSGSDTLFGNDKFGISSNSYQYNDGNTLNKNVRQELGATVRNKYFSLTGGLETTYDTTNINPASRGAFFTPKVFLGDKASLSFKNKISGQNMEKYEPTLGIDYAPFKNSSIWFGAGATIRNNVMQSQSLNLKTNFYIF